MPLRPTEPHPSPTSRHYRKRADATERYAGEPDAFMENIRPHFDVILAAIAAGRAELIRLQRQGQIEDEVLHDLDATSTWKSWASYFSAATDA